MLCMVTGSFGGSVYEDRNGIIWIADREAELMVRHDSEDPELSWYRGVPYRREGKVRSTEEEGPEDSYWVYEANSRS